MMNQMGMGFFPWQMLLVPIVFVLAIAAVTRLVWIYPGQGSTSLGRPRRSRSTAKDQRLSADGAILLLRERYARGEIDHAQLELGIEKQLTRESVSSRTK